MSARKGVRVLLAGVAVIVLGTPARTFAQAPPAPKPAPSSGRVELAVGGFVFGETSYGSIDAQFITNSGNPLTVFRTESALRPGFGFEVHLGVGLTSSLSLEASGSWTRADFRTRVLDDFEGAGDAVLKETLTRFAVEGSALWAFKRGSKVTWFARGGAGWMRDLTGNDSLVDDGIIGNLGVGMKYLWKPAGRGFKGVRVEGRALAQKGGLAIGAEKLRLTPAAAGSLIIGF